MIDAPRAKMIVRMFDGSASDACASDIISAMPTEHILTLLIEERDKLNRAIEVLQGTKPRGGRPLKNPTAVAASGGNNDKKKRSFSAAQRKKQSARMKAYWAAKKKSER